MTKIQTVKQKLKVLIADSNRKPEIEVEGSDRRQYIIRFHSYDIVTILRMHLGTIEKELISRGKKDFKRNLDKITESEVRMIREVNRIADREYRRMYSEVRKENEMFDLIESNKIEIYQTKLAIEELEKQKIGVKNIHKMKLLNRFVKWKKQNIEYSTKQIEELESNLNSLDHDLLSEYRRALIFTSYGDKL